MGISVLGASNALAQSWPEKASSLSQHPGVAATEGRLASLLAPH